MKTRPWPLVLLALFQILTPVGTILLNALILGVSPIQVLDWILERPPLEAFRTLALMPIAGVAIYMMRSWSYVIFFAAIVWSIGGTLQSWNYATASFPLAVLVLVHFFQLLLGTYFLLPSVRRTYLDPSVRWWESKPRYELEVEIDLVSPDRAITGTMLNISEGGAFAKIPYALQKEIEVELAFSVLSRKFRVPAKIVHVRLTPGTNDGFYGLEFMHSRATHLQFKKLARALEDLGFPDRSGNQPWYREFWSWLRTLLKTGKGLTPEVKSERQSS